MRYRRNAPDKIYPARIRVQRPARQTTFALLITRIFEKIWLKMSCTSTPYGDHLHEVSFESLENCRRSLRHKLLCISNASVQNLSKSKGRLNLNPWAGTKNKMSCTSTLDGDHLYKVSFESLGNCRSLHHKLIGTKQANSLNWYPLPKILLRKKRLIQFLLLKYSNF